MALRPEGPWASTVTGASCKNILTIDNRCIAAATKLPSPEGPGT